MILLLSKKIVSERYDREKPALRKLEVDLKHLISWQQEYK